MKLNDLIQIIDSTAQIKIYDGSKGNIIDGTPLVYNGKGFAFGPISSSQREFIKQYGEREIGVIGAGTYDPTAPHKYPWESGLIYPSIAIFLK